MKKVIRQSVFETNSSSTHSISLGGKTPLSNKDTRLVYKGMNEVVIYPGEFGWGIEKFNDAATKASYALTWVKEKNNGELEQMLREVIEEATGLPVKFQQDVDNFYPWGYIDHKSSDVCYKAFESKKSLRNFIFNPESILIIDNDNHE